MTAAARVTITHPDKILFPEDGITKSELAAYYDAVASVMLPHLRRRPITMERFPAGIGAKGFLQKDVVKGFPEWLTRVEAPKKGGTVHYPLATDRRSLQWLANQNTVTLHVWPSRAPGSPSARTLRDSTDCRSSGVMQHADAAVSSVLPWRSHLTRSSSSSPSVTASA